MRKNSEQVLSEVNVKLYELEGILTEYFICGENSDRMSNETLILIREQLVKLVDTRYEFVNRVVIDPIVKRLRS